jgi:Galactose oxidase, central domain
MAKALPAGRATRRRTFFGFFDAEGWAWAGVKAGFWLLVIIMTLGYIPDRAYYFFVSRTIELGIVGWSPINLCPPENGSTMPCPVPAGGVLPWQAAPGDTAALPEPRSGGVALQLGKNLLYIGGSDGSSASDASYLTQIDKGAFGAWSEGPALPEGRTDAGLATLSGTAYLVGGAGPDGTPTNTVWKIGLDPDTSALTTWTPVCTEAETEEEPCADDKILSLPAARSGAAVVAVSDGIVVAGGLGPDGAPTTTVWKSTLDAKEGALGAFEEMPGLPLAVTDASVAFEGTYLWIIGGSDASGPVGAVQRADYGATPGPTAEPGEPAPSAAPEVVLKWTADNALNLPAPRTGAAGFAANGALYVVGGSDGTSAKRELYWALPNATGNLPGNWRHLDATDLPTGLSDAAVLVTGATAILIGGNGPDGTLATSTKSSLAPQEPFFKVGLVGVVVPALKIGGEIGQQLGYLAAAGVGTGNFVILVAIGWAFNHKPQIAGWLERRRIAKEAKAPEEG